MKNELLRKLGGLEYEIWKPEQVFHVQLTPPATALHLSLHGEDIILYFHKIDIEFDMPLKAMINTAYLVEYMDQDYNL